MGGGASCTAEEQSNLPLIKLEYLAQLKKPIDGSDCNNDLILAKSEISKLRTLCRSIDPSLVEEFFNKQQEQQDKRARDEVEKNERKQSEEKEEHSIVNLLKEKLDNRLVSLQEAFRKIDTTNTGFITKEEFIQSCWYWGIQLEESDFTYLTTIIGPSNQRIQYKEFLTIMTTILDQKGVFIGHEHHQAASLTSIPVAVISRSSSSAASSSSPAVATADILRSRVLDSGLTMKQAFLKFDLNGSGSIEKDEMKEVLTLFQIPVTNSELDDLFVKFDVNRDQRFQYGEFVRIIQTRA